MVEEEKPKLVPSKQRTRLRDVEADDMGTVKRMNGD